MNDLRVAGIMAQVNQAARQEAVEAGCMMLGETIATLASFDQSAAIRFDLGGSPRDPHSYRGYYVRLAFERDNDSCTVGEFRTLCADALGQTFQGWKGGDFKMDRATLLHTAYEGYCGPMIVGFTPQDDGSIVIDTRLENDDA